MVWVFMDDVVLYNGRVVDLWGKMGEVVVGLGNCKNFKGVVVIRRFEEVRDVRKVLRVMMLDEFVGVVGRNLILLGFVRVGFCELLLVCYSSGMMGMLKVIVYLVGGILINYFKEGRLYE